MGDHAKIGIGETLLTTFSVFKNPFWHLFKAVIPLIVLAQALEYLGDRWQSPWSVGLLVVAWVVGAWATVVALRMFLDEADPETPPLKPVTVWPFILFLFFQRYVSLASMLGAAFFIVPALLIYASAVIAPVLILRGSHGPFEAIGDSVDATRGNVWRITAMLLVVWAAITGIALVGGIAAVRVAPGSIVMSQLVGLVLAVLGLFNYALMAVLYVRLRDRVSLPTTDSVAAEE